MKRVVKKPEVRRIEIIAIAEQLFEERGYANTSVEAIIQTVGIAKGTFYYYFKTKQDLLRACVEHIGSEIEALIISIIDLNNLTAMEKLQQIIRGPEKTKIVTSTVMKTIHTSENRELQEQLNIQMVEIIAPLIVKVLELGYKEGIFSKIASVESIQLILAGSAFVLESGLFEWSSKKEFALLQTVQTIFEFVVGAKPGLLSFISDKR